MRFSISTLPSVPRVNALHSAGTSLRYLDTLWGRSVLSAFSWLVVGVAPLVAFDAGGGQTAVDLVRYVVFRGLDRDAWYAISALSMFSGVLSAVSFLIGLVIHTTGFMSRDRSLVFWGGGVTLVGLVVLVVATEPIAAFAMLGSAALPHVGWWLTLFYTTSTVGMACGWTSELDPQTC